MSELAQQVIVAATVILALLYFVRLRIRSAKAKSGSCPKCTIDH